MKPRDEADHIDLRGYAAIGDGRTVALIAPDGAVDWLPIAALHSAPVFARILDAEHGGRIELQPDGPFESERRYIPATNVLETVVRTTGGSARMTDALVGGFAGRLPWPELARRVEGLEGSVRFRWRVAPGTRLASAAPWVQDTMHGPVIRIDDVTIVVRGSDHGPHDSGEREVTGAFTTVAGSRHLLVVTGSEADPVHVPVPELTDDGLDRTIETWRSWSRDFGYDGRWSDAVQRSALVLKLLMYEPTGAIAAAATTSLPESLEGGKNWDYRFAWVRDVAYVVRSLVRFGLREETHAAIAWLTSAITRHGPKMRIFYGLDGSLPGGVEELDVPGWRGIGPVVVGNRANDQFQFGVYGDLLSVMRVYVEAGNVLDPGTAELLSRFADEVTGIWRQRDSGIWELPTVRHYTSSKMGCWQALTEAARLQELGAISGDVAFWRAEAKAIREWVAQNCWSEQRQAYVAWPDATSLDAAVLLHAASGFDRSDRMSRTISAVFEELGSGPLLYRFTGADQEEGAFVACSFWAASALACVGRLEEAVRLLDELLPLANDVGLYAEMIDPRDGAFLGNLPQGLSHLALIEAAIMIDELSDESPDAPQ